MINALAACEHLLIPVQTEFLALKGLERMQRSLEMIQRSRGSALSYTVVPTMFDRRTRASIQSLRRLREEYAQNLWHSVIPIDTQFREASKAGRPLSIMNRRARGSIAFAELLDTLLARELREPARAVS
jgi:chromosome partitioning protein